MEEGRVVLTKTSKRILKVRVFVFQPGIDEPGTEGTHLAFKTTFKWVTRFKTLVAIDCWHEPPDDNPLTESICTNSVKVISNVIKVMVSGDITNAKDGGLPKVAKCIKERVVEYTNKEVEECMIVALDSGMDNADQAIKEKIRQRTAQGYTCTADGRCKKVVSLDTNREKELLEAQEVRGHLEA